ncbi:MAG: hypothetical protein U5L96_11160 [Owenweeksia sp.]|nr:hypothetical protein [Owenweeksia sp.]
MNVHLASVGLENADYEALEKPGYENQEGLKKGIRAIVTRLHHSYQRRDRQITPVQEAVRDSPHPVVASRRF